MMNFVNASPLFSTHFWAGLFPLH